VKHLYAEHLSGAMHDYMAAVKGARQAQDDAATEVIYLVFLKVPRSNKKQVDEDGPKMPEPHPNPSFARGYNSRYVENPVALMAYQEWPEFIHREEMRQQAGPSIHESQFEARRAYESEARNLNTLRDAGKAIEEQYPESNVTSSAQRDEDEASALEGLAMLGDPRHTLTPPNYQSQVAKRPRMKWGSSKEKQRSSSVQGQRPLLPAPSTAPLPELPMSPYGYSNPYAQFAPPSMATPATAHYGLPLPIPQPPQGYHALPPPPPGYLNSPYAAILMGGVPLFPRPPPHPIQPFYPPPPPMIHPGPPPPRQFSPPAPQPPTPRQP
jgi:hypothetical protein